MARDTRDFLIPPALGLAISAGVAAGAFAEIVSAGLTESLIWHYDAKASFPQSFYCGGILLATPLAFGGALGAAVALGAERLGRARWPLPLAGGLGGAVPGVLGYALLFWREEWRDIWILVTVGRACPFLGVGGFLALRERSPLRHGSAAFGFALATFAFTYRYRYVSAADFRLLAGVAVTVVTFAGYCAFVWWALERRRAALAPALDDEAAADRPEDA